MHAICIHVHVHDYRSGPAEYERLLGKRREMEGIEAAIKDAMSGRVFTAPTHREAVNAAVAALNINFSGGNLRRAGLIDGFMLHGRFMTREEVESRFGSQLMEGLAA